MLAITFISYKRDCTIDQVKVLVVNTINIDNALQEFVDFSMKFDSDFENYFVSDIQSAFLSNLDEQFQGNVDSTSEAHIEYLRMRANFRIQFNDANMINVCFGTPDMATFFRERRAQVYHILKYELDHGFPRYRWFNINGTCYIGGTTTKRAK